MRCIYYFDDADTAEDYVHRIGRTGRAGAKGTAYTFFTTKNAHGAKGLVAVLRQANMDVPEDLETMISYSAGGGGGGRRGGGGGRGGGGSGGGTYHAPVVPFWWWWLVVVGGELSGGRSRCPVCLCACYSNACYVGMMKICFESFWLPLLAFQKGFTRLILVRRMMIVHASGAILTYLPACLPAFLSTHV